MNINKCNLSHANAPSTTNASIHFVTIQETHCTGSGKIEVFTALWTTTGGRMLTRIAFSAGHVNRLRCAGRQSMMKETLFPGLQYGLNGKHLVVSTKLVREREREETTQYGTIRTAKAFILMPLFMTWHTVQYHYILKLWSTEADYY